MKPARAVAILVVPFAGLAMLSVAGMCLTSYWECKVVGPFSSAWVMPILFLFSAFVVGAAIVLCVDLMLLTILPAGRSGTVLVTLLGAVAATLPLVMLHAVGDQGLGAVNPQLEYLPFLTSGAVFAFLLDRLVNSRRIVTHDA